MPPGLNHEEWTGETALRGGSLVLALEVTFTSIRFRLLKTQGDGGQVTDQTPSFPVSLLSRLLYLLLSNLPTKILMFLLILASVKPEENCQQPFSRDCGEQSFLSCLFLEAPVPAEDRTLSPFPSASGRWWRVQCVPTKGHAVLALESVGESYHGRQLGQFGTQHLPF